MSIDPDLRELMVALAGVYKPDRTEDDCLTKALVLEGRSNESKDPKRRAYYAQLSEGWK